MPTTKPNATTPKPSLGSLDEEVGLRLQLQFWFRVWGFRV